MKNNSLALATAIALCVNGIGAGLVSPQAGAASIPDHNPAALGALPAWFAAIPDEAYPAGAASLPGHNPAAPGALPAWFAAIPAEARPTADRENGKPRLLWHSCLITGNIHVDAGIWSLLHHRLLSAPCR